MRTTYQIITFLIIACIVNANLGGGIHDILPTLSREELERWALAAERFHNKVNGREGIIGGLHDYIRSLSVEEIITYINKKVEEHSEINSQKAFEDLIENNKIRYVFRRVGGDGGLSSMMWRTDRDTLTKWALACEKYHNKDKDVLGGLHDVIGSWTREDIMKYIIQKTGEHQEIKNLQKLNDLAGIKNEEDSSYIGRAYKYLSEIFYPKPRIGGLHDYIFQVPRDKLAKWALAVENYVRNVKGELILGGIHDYIGTATIEEIANYILDEAYKYPELDSSDKLNELAKEEEKMRLKLGEGLHDIIQSLPREKLVTWALAIENWVREVKKVVIFGGIHDYIAKATIEEIRKYILEQADKYPELNSKKKLDEISETFYVQRLGGLHDYINTISREQLAKWALAIEDYERNVKGVIKFGGIHDYIESISIEDLRKYILREADKYPELDSRTKLDELSEKQLKVKLGGLHDYIFQATREQLVEWALACENYRRNIKLFFGGIHDYIDTATREQITNYILDSVQRYPELDSVEKLNELSQQTKLGNLGGLHDFIFRVPRVQLVAWALAVENYEREEKKVVKFGGIHDYIDVATSEEIANYIIQMANKYQELNSVDFLNQISKQSLKSRQVGGLEDYIWREPRENLVKWALNVEIFIRRVKKVKIFGGIHDYIGTASREEIIKYILEKAAIYDELNSAEKLDNLEEYIKNNSTPEER